MTGILKRPALDPDGGDGDKPCKKMRLTYGPTIAITVAPGLPVARKTGYPYNTLNTCKTFHVHKDLLAGNASCLRQHIDSDEAGTEIVLESVDPEQFKAYLDWLYTGQLDDDSIQSSSARLLSGLAACSGDAQAEQNRDTTIVRGIYRLLVMSINHLQDIEFERLILDMLESRVAGPRLSKCPLEIDEAQVVWKEISEIHLNIRRWIVENIAKSISRADVESQRQKMSARLIAALRVALPPMMTIIVGQEGVQTSFRVDQDEACKYSRFFKEQADHHEFSSGPLSVWLSDENHHVFDSYLKFRKAWKINGIVPGSSYWMNRLRHVSCHKPVSRTESYELLICRLWLLASRIEDSSFQNHIVDSLVALWNEHPHAFSRETLLLVSQETRIGSPLRKCVVHVASPTISKDFLETEARSLSMDFILELFAKMAEIRDEGGELSAKSWPKPAESSKYHVAMD